MKFIFRNTDEFRPKTHCLDSKTGKRHELEISGGPGDWSIATDSEILAADLAMNRPWTMAMPARYAFPLIPNDLGLTNRRQCVFVAGRKAPLAWDRKIDKLEDVFVEAPAPEPKEVEIVVEAPAPEPDPIPAPKAPDSVANLAARAKAAVK